MAKSKASPMSAVIERLRGKDDIALVDIMKLAEMSVDNLKSALETIDSSIYREFRGIAANIAKTRKDISQLQSAGLTPERIPEAGLELRAIVDATEEATHRIMESAETIMTADASNPSTYYNIVNDNVLAIFEACSFQDLTGQRISKIVETLEHIDKRISRFASAIGIDDIPEGEAAFDEEEKAREKRNKDLLLHGPQTTGGVSQDDIDSIFD